MLEQWPRSLLFRVEGRLFAIPVTHVRETMRVLPIEPISGAPKFVLGISVIRGAPSPVIDTALLLGMHPSERPSRIILVNVDGRAFALLVSTIVGIETLRPEAVEERPTLFEGIIPEMIAAVSSLHSELLMALRATHLVPDSVWRLIEERDRAGDC